MEFILKQIEQALEKKIHYLAVVSVLTLPDVCSALEADDGRATPQRYKDWVDKHVSPIYSRLTGQDLYMLRCGVVHQGRLGPRHMQYDLIVFTIEGAMHNNISQYDGDKNQLVLQLDANHFCHDLIKIVRQWYAEKENEPNVKRNLPFVLQLRPKGLPPHFFGMPIIA